MISSSVPLANSLYSHNKHIKSWMWAIIKWKLINETHRHTLVPRLSHHQILEGYKHDYTYAISKAVPLGGVLTVTELPKMKDDAKRPTRSMDSRTRITRDAYKPAKLKRKNTRYLLWFLSRKTEPPATCPLAASSDCQKPPGGLSAAFHVMEAVSVASTISQPRSSSSLSDSDLGNDLFVSYFRWLPLEKPGRRWSPASAAAAT